MLRLAVATAGLGVAGSSSALASAAPGHCPTPRPSTCRGGAGSTCSTSSWSISKSHFRSATSPISPSWGLTSSGCRWITDAGPTATSPKKLKEPVLKEIDQAVELGRKYGVHVQINFHRAPGFTVASPPEPKSLWTDAEIQEVCAHHWASFAARYQGMPNNLVSFNPLNEPDDKVKPEDHRTVIERIAEAIRAKDPQRLIVCDGRGWATAPPTELIGLDVAAALHDYNPMPLTHYKASWVNWDESWPEPVWPLKKNDGKYVVRATIARELINPWKEFEAKGVGVMVGEFGVFNQTPHRFALSWMNDTLAEFKTSRLGLGLVELHRRLRHLR